MTTTDIRPLIDVEQVEREFREIIHQNPDRTNGTSCSYVVIDDVAHTGCVAGVWLIETHGMNPEWFLGFGNRNTQFFQELYEREPDAFPFRLTEGAVELVNAVQAQADNDGNGNVLWDELDF